MACSCRDDGVLVGSSGRRLVATVDVRIRIIFAVISATPWGHWHIGISCFLPRGIVIQLSVCSNMPAFRHRSPAKWAHAEPLSRAQRVWLGHRRPATSYYQPEGPLQPLRPRPPPPRYTSLASRGMVACPQTMLEAVQGRSSATHRGLERNSFSLLVSYRTLATCFVRAQFVDTSPSRPSCPRSRRRTSETSSWGRRAAPSCALLTWRTRR